MPSPNGDGFEVLWKKYPRPRGKQAARREWARLKPDEALLAEMLAALDWQRQQPDWMKEDQKYVPYPARWLRERRWEDEPPALPTMSRTAPEPACTKPGSADLEVILRRR